MRKYIFLFLTITVGIIPNDSFSTGQYGDRLIIGNDTSWINSNTLEDYFKIKGERTIGKLKLHVTCTAIWRGYVAT